MKQSSVDMGEKLTRIVKGSGPIWLSELARKCRITKGQAQNLVDALPHVHIPNPGNYKFSGDGRMYFNFKVEWSKEPVFPDEEIVGIIPFQKVRLSL
ncbi:MAG: hypothetical protein JKY52_00090 [Flavobacteriales bacterium]|nr:hypothetical protein [Flavobacteriales bacterium]